MTAASGNLPQEFHPDACTRQGGTLETAQLRVNLPARDTMGEPTAQEIPQAIADFDGGRFGRVA